MSNTPFTDYPSGSLQQRGLPIGFVLFAFASLWVLTFPVLWVQIKALLSCLFPSIFVLLTAIHYFCKNI